MPVISRFFGIVVFMNYREHDPPHFHARHGSDEVLINIATGAMTGTLSSRASLMLRDWTDLHRSELLMNWERASRHLPLEPIAPLT
jgi:hypothetical protein